MRRMNKRTLAAGFVIAAMAPQISGATSMHWGTTLELSGGLSVNSKSAEALRTPAPSRDHAVDFMGLGWGGRALFDFGAWFSGRALIHKTTWGERSGARIRYPEWADISVSDAYDFGSGIWANGIRRHFPTAGRVGNGAAVFAALIDASPRSSTNGFDVKAVGAAPAPVPLPAAATLLAGALCVLAVAGRRRRPPASDLAR